MMPIDDDLGINGGSGDQDQSQELSSIPTEDHDFPEDPALSLSEEEIDDEKGKNILDQIHTSQKRRPTKPSLIMRQCLEKSFANEDELKDFCFDFAEEVHRELKESDRSKYIIRTLIIYCETRDEIESFWSSIEVIRPNQYKKFFPRWQKAYKAYQQWRENRDAMEAFDFVEDYTFEPGFIAQENSVPSATGNQPHALTSDEPIVINDWFFNDLNRPEQSMVLTVALFEGINRKYMAPIAKELEQRLDGNISTDD
ncbi:MAG: hypothetical protein H6632_01640 [Anaerolineales bacterium]|nr:hypothetical protein [Anaerolineales bacterium]